MWLGMNLATVIAELAKWAQLIEEIAKIITDTDTQVQAADEAWNGDDSMRFVSTWNDTHKPNLESIKNMVQELHDKLDQDIRQQEQTSGN